MPMLTAQKHQWTKQPPYNFYHFPDEHLAGWKAFWEEMDGDTGKILDFAKTAKIECPAEWFESLHRFLFGVFYGEPLCLKTAAGKTFGDFIGQALKNHKEKPKEKDWYTVRGITQTNFVAMLERASEIKDIRQAVAFVNAKVKDLGFYLYSEYILAKTTGKSKIKSVAADLNKQAYTLECEAIGDTPLRNVKKGTVFTHAADKDNLFMVTEVVENEKQDIDMFVVRDQKGHVSFIKDLWNVQVV